MKRNNVISYYDVLEISRQATSEQIHEAYRRLALRYHPDQNAQTRRLATLRFKLISEAYQALNTPEKRARYDLMHMSQLMKASNNNMPLGLLSKMKELFQTSDTTS